MLPATDDLLLRGGVHLLNAALLFGALRSDRTARGAARAAAPLFLLHPVSVLLMDAPARAGLALSAWMLAAWLDARRRARPSTAVDLALLVVLGAGILASPVLLLLPAALLAADAGRPGTRLHRLRQLATPALVALLGAALHARFLPPLDGFTASLSGSARLGLAAEGAVHGLALLGAAIPVDAMPRVPADPVALPAIGAMLVLLALGGVAFALRPALRAGLGWLALAVVGLSFGAAHDPFASPAVALGVGTAGVARLAGTLLAAVPRPARTLALALLCLALAVRTGSELQLRTDPVAALGRTVERDPGHWSARAALASRLAERGEIAAAREQYRAALRTQPRFAWAQTALADLLRDEGRPEEARLLYANVLQTGWNDPQAGLRLAFVLLRLGWPRDAAVLLARAPDSGDAHAGRALAAALEGEAETARRELDRALAAGVDGVDARYACAWLLATAGEVRDPEQALSFVHEDDPPRLQDAAAAALAAQGRYAEAFARAQAAAAALERDGWPARAAAVRERARHYLGQQPWTWGWDSAPAADGEVHQ